MEVIDASHEAKGRHYTPCPQLRSRQINHSCRCTPQKYPKSPPVAEVGLNLRPNECASLIDDVGRDKGVIQVAATFARSLPFSKDTDRASRANFYSLYYMVTTRTK